MTAPRRADGPCQLVRGNSAQPGNAPDPLLMKEVHETMEIERMLDQEFKAQHVVPSEAEMQHYYEDHKDLFVGGGICLPVDGLRGDHEEVARPGLYDIPASRTELEPEPACDHIAVRVVIPVVVPSRHRARLRADFDRAAVLAEGASPQTMPTVAALAASSSSVLRTRIFATAEPPPGTRRFSPSLPSIGNGALED